MATARDALTLLPAWHERPLTVALPGGETGMVFGGVRAVLRGDGSVEVTPTTSSVALVEATALARGFVFRDESQRLWRADSFLGALASVGDGVVVLHPRATGGAMAFRSAGAIYVTDGHALFRADTLAAGSPFDVRICADGRGEAIAADGLVDESTDGGHSWTLRTTTARASGCDEVSPPMRALTDAEEVRVRAQIVRALPTAIDAMRGVTIADGSALVSMDDGAVAWWSADRSRVTTLDDARGCQVAAWGSCAAVLCEARDGAPTLRRACGEGELRTLAHPCRGAFVLSDDGRHALCATRALAVVALDATTGTATTTELPFRRLPTTTLHGAEAWSVEATTLHGPHGDETLPLAMEAVAWLGDTPVGHLAGRLWARERDGTWRRVEEIPWQPSGGEAGRFLARDDVSPAWPRFECADSVCRFGAAVVRDLSALRAPPPEATPPPASQAEEEQRLLQVDATTLSGCVASGVLTRRRTIAGVTLDAPVHATAAQRDDGADLRWMTENGVATSTFAAGALPTALAPGDDPENLYAQGMPAAIAATPAALFVVTPTGAEGPTLWTLHTGREAPTRAALPGALPTGEDDTRWDGVLAVDGALAVAQRVTRDDGTTTALWHFAPDGALVGRFVTRSREAPAMAVLEGAPGILTWTRGGGDEVALAFRGVAAARRWAVRAREPLAPCADLRGVVGYADMAIEQRVERDVPPGSRTLRSVIRVTQARVALGDDGVCVAALRGASGAPAGQGTGIRSADLFLTARAGGYAGVEQGGDAAIPIRCMAPMRQPARR